MMLSIFILTKKLFSVQNLAARAMLVLVKVGSKEDLILVLPVINFSRSSKHFENDIPLCSGS